MVSFAIRLEAVAVRLEASKVGPLSQSILKQTTLKTLIYLDSLGSTYFKLEF